MTNEELALRLQHGDTEALGLLWNNVARFVYKIVRRYTPTPSVGFDDLVQCAFFGVREAALNFDGRPFLTLLTWCIQRACRTALGLRGGRRQVDACASLDAPLTEETGDTLGDLIPDDSLPEHGEAIELEELRRAVREAVDALPAREGRIIRGHWFDGKLLDDLAESEGVSRERVRQLEQIAFGRLRKALAPYYTAPTPCEVTGLSSFWYRGASATELQALANLQRLEREDAAYCRLLEAQIVTGRLTMETARVFLASFRESRGWRCNPGISP